MIIYAVLLHFNFVAKFTVKKSEYGFHKYRTGWGGGRYYAIMPKQNYIKSSFHFKFMTFFLAAATLLLPTL